MLKEGMRQPGGGRGVSCAEWREKGLNRCISTPLAPEISSSRAGEGFGRSGPSRYYSARMRTLLGLDTRVLYTLLIGVVAAGRLFELRIAGRNYQALLARGGVEVGSGHYRWMVLLHT